MKQRVVVTGGAGYIGSHTAKALWLAGYDPVVIDDFRTGDQKFIRWGSFFKADIADKKTVVDILKTVKPVAVMHFAGSALVGESVENPQKYYENNVLGSLQLLQAMHEADCRKIVFSSSCAIYGHADGIAIDESFIPRPINPYGQTKLMVENLISNLCSADRFLAVSLRYFNAAGADPQGELGEERSHETHLIPRAIAAARKRQTLEILGTDYSTQDGTCVRDYVHVSDLAKAHVLSLHRLLHQQQRQSYEAFNLGTGKGYSVWEVIRMVEQITGQKISARVVSRRAGDPAFLIASGKRAQQDLRWAPEFSDLQSMIQHAVNWDRRSHTEMDPSEGIQFL